MRENKKKIVHCGIGWLLLIAGFADSLYLSVSHYRVYTDLGYRSFCAVSKSLNCDTVSQSAFSIFLGMPVPVWGILGYLLLLIIFPFLFQNKNLDKRLWTLFFSIVSFFSIYSLSLAFISAFYIHTYCLMCIVLYGIILSLFFYSYRVIKTIKGGGFFNRLFSDMVYLKTKAHPLMLLVKLFFMAVVLIWMFFPNYWVFGIKNETAALPTGVTEDGCHWVGAENPEITIVEFTDYMCFQCRKMHFQLRSMVAANPNTMRLVHRNFPLDKSYNFAIKDDLHMGAGKMAMLAIYAGLRDRFWEMNDILFQIDISKSAIKLDEIAHKSGFEPGELAWALKQTNIRLLLKRDIAAAVKAGVQVTPSYIVNGRLFDGTIPPELIKK